MPDALDGFILGAIGGASTALFDDLAVRYLTPGQTLSHYRIIERIGEGGMGVVYKAEDTRLGRSVAIKSLPSFLGSDAISTQAFEREARTASSLNHPAICTIHEFGEHEQQPFIVMELLDGETLRQRLDRGPLDRGLAIEVAIAVLSALDAAHALGIVHCDIKPANIFLTTQGLVKILDFGIARLDRDRADHNAAVVGTQPYMSPEQARGDALDGRTDIYSLGAVIREMVGDATGPTLERVINRMTVPERELRYATASEPLATLQQIQKQRRSRTTSRVAWALAAAAILAAVTLPWWMTGRPPPLAERDQVLVADFENRSNDPAFDGILTSVVSSQLGQSPYVSVMPESIIQEQLQLMRRPPDTRLTPEVAKELSVRATVKVFLTGSLSRVGNRYWIALDAVNSQTGAYVAQRSAEAATREDVLGTVGTVTSEIRKDLGESMASVQRFDVPVRSATTGSLEAYRAYNSGLTQSDAGLGNARNAIPFFLKAIALDPDFALAYASLASAYGNIREEKLAAQNAHAAFLRRERVTERERITIAYRYYIDVTGEISKALEVYQLGLSVYPAEAAFYNGLMVRYKDLGELEKAAAAGERAVSLRRSPLFLSNLAGTYVKLMRLDQAQAIGEELLRVGATTNQMNLLEIALIRGDQDELRRRDEGFKNATVGYLYAAAQARLAGRAGRLTDARERFAESTAGAAKRGQPDRAALTTVQWALLEAVTGNTARARALADQVVAGRPTRLTAADAAVVLAVAGDVRAQEVLATLRTEHPLDEYLRDLYEPLIAGVMALRAGRAEAAVTALRPLDTFDRGEVADLRPGYFRGLAYLALGAGGEATRMFKQTLSRQGINARSPIVPMAQLGLARASALSGDAAAARQAYQTFFAIWKDADQDVPILIEARREYAALH